MSNEVPNEKEIIAELSKDSERLLNEMSGKDTAEQPKNQERGFGDDPEQDERQRRQHEQALEKEMRPEDIDLTTSAVGGARSREGADWTDEVRSEEKQRSSEVESGSVSSKHSQEAGLGDSIQSGVERGAGESHEMGL